MVRYDKKKDSQTNAENNRKEVFRMIKTTYWFD